MSLVVTVSIYRSFSLWKKVWTEPLIAQKRYHILSAFVSLLLDPFLLLSVILIFIHHRYFRQFWATLTTLSGYQKHLFCLKTLNQVVYDTITYDIPTVFAISLLYATLWRVPSLRRDLSQLPTPITLEKYRDVHLLHLVCWAFDPLMIVCYGFLHLGWSLDELKQKLLVRWAIFRLTAIGSPIFGCS